MSAEKAVARLTRLHQSLCCAESLTGGLISDAIVCVPGASRVFLGGIVAYDERMKTRLLGVSEGTLKAHTAVSDETALEMARGARARFSADHALSATGYAGPGGEEVGLVYLGYAGMDGEEVLCCHFQGDRAAIRSQAVTKSIQLLLKHIDKGE